MKSSTNKTVYIPQLKGLRRTLYIDENNKKYIRIDGKFWELEEYKSYLKNQFAKNISYLIEGDSYDNF